MASVLELLSDTSSWQGKKEARKSSGLRPLPGPILGGASMSKHRCATADLPGKAPEQFLWHCQGPWSLRAAPAPPESPPQTGERTPDWSNSTCWGR